MYVNVIGCVMTKETILNANVVSLCVKILLPARNGLILAVMLWIQETAWQFEAIFGISTIPYDGRSIFVTICVEIDSC